MKWMKYHQPKKSGFGKEVKKNSLTTLKSECL